MKEEPGPTSGAIGRYVWLPDKVQPRVWCGCGGRMRPVGGEERPHEFDCEECKGFIDLHPPDQGWEPKRCGVMKHSLRCNNPINLGEMVCTTCVRDVISDGFTKNQRPYMRELLGQEELAQELFEQRQAHLAAQDEKRAAQDATRKETAHHVVYYCRLGNNHIKIGTTGDLPRRMVELRVVNVTNLLAAEPGGYELEHQRHTQFRKWRYQRRKEDFGEGPDLLQHIKDVRAQHGDPYALAAKLATPAASTDPAA